MVTRCRRKEAESGKVKVVKAGNGTLHPIEARFLAPEVHTLMRHSRTVVRAEDLDRVILQVSQPKSGLKGTYVLRYIRYGEKQTFASSKSESVPVAERTTCAARNPWYDLSGAKPGFAFWPMAQQYRHIVPTNPHGLICNHNLFDLRRLAMEGANIEVLGAVLNSTVAAFWKNFYGRYAGTEGNLKTEVVDVNLLEIPNPHHTTKAVAKRLCSAFDKICQRDVGSLVEERFMQCKSPERMKKIAGTPVRLPRELRQEDRRELDDAVFEILGVRDTSRRRKLVELLYRETALHYRHIRIMEVQKQEQRRKTKKRRFSADELAADVWDVLESEWKKPFVEQLSKDCTQTTSVDIPNATVYLADPNDMFEATTVFFEKDRKVHVELPHRPIAELVAALAEAGVTGQVECPAQEDDCKRTLATFREQRRAAQSRFDELADSRTGTDPLKTQIVVTLTRWWLSGKPEPGS